jgi:Secretion system C-terminal sorting domain
MKKLIFCSLILVWLGSSSAQSFVGRINQSPAKTARYTGNSDTVHILAVMVEFKEYNDPTVSGTGLFGSIYTQNYGDTILDPVPFDATYFSSHLDFAKNYFSKVSNGKLNVAYKILPQVITVSQRIRDYSPTPENQSDLSGEARFVQEVWQLAGSTFTNVDFSKYDLFAVFHAGVGREFRVPGSTGNERDLSSVYFGFNALQNVFGSGFLGFPVNSGSYLIKNSMILPSTESREVAAVSGKTLLQLTTNGLIVNSIASYLGLPDLFNTTTGTTAIGRFGLMDGSSTFAYSGLFPPEPSAWEKIYLGWVQPVTLSIGDARIGLVTRVAASMNDTTILKIPINSTEYFLVENRQRDANKDGIKLTYNLHGRSYLFSLDKDKGGFQWYGVDTLKGVVTDCDEFDWAVPGNGLLIWHIDENIINQTIAEDKINADPNHRGIYIEEADGILDIGIQYTTVTGDVGYGDGTYQDLWFLGNDAIYYKNIFGPSSKPNSNSNYGASSLITLNNFSAPADKMGFNVSFGYDGVKPVSSSLLNLSSSGKLLAGKSFAGNSNVYIADNSNVTKYDLKGNLLKSLTGFSAIQPVVFDYNGTEFIVGANGRFINLYSIKSGQETINSFDILSQVTALSVDKLSSSTPKLIIGTSAGNVFAVQIDDAFLIRQFVPDNYQIYKGDTAILNFGIDNNFYSILQSGKITAHTSQDVSYSIGSSGRKSVLSKNTDGGHSLIVLGDQNRFYIFGGNSGSFQINSQNTLSDFAVADLLGNGQNYIIVSEGNSIKAFNFQGSMADHFPFILSTGENFEGLPLVADINKDGQNEIIAFTDKGNVYALNSSTGKILDGFPISSGTQSASVPVLISEDLSSSGQIGSYKPYLILLDKSNRLYVWNLSPVQGNTYWSAEFKDGTNSSFADAPAVTNKVSDFFPSERAYNWPNPVYGGDTKIRYYVGENSSVQIKIFDLAGGLVADINTRATGGFDNETTWNVAKIQSGVYYAHLQINGDSGKSAQKIIKIAVIK